MLSAMQEVALRMRFARRFFLLFLLIAPFVPTGHAVMLTGEGVTRVAALAAISEINPMWTAVGSCIVATALILRHSAKFRR